MSDPITLAQSRAPPSPATATPPLPIVRDNGASHASNGNGKAPELARSSGSLQVRGRSPTPTRGGGGDRYGGDSDYGGSTCGSLRGSSVRGSSPVIGDDKPTAASASAVAASASVRGTSPPPPVAPYQALPVRGPVNLITHNMTEGLPVVEPGETDPKVRWNERAIDERIRRQLGKKKKTQPLLSLSLSKQKKTKNRSSRPA